MNNYDFLKDVERIENLSTTLKNFEIGYTIWLTNDQLYLKEPRKDASYQKFSVYDDSTKTGTMNWGLKTGKNREKPITLNGKYKINWKEYSNLESEQGPTVFHYTLLTIENPNIKKQ